LEEGGHAFCCLWVKEEDEMTALAAIACRRFWDRRGVAELTVLLSLFAVPALVMFVFR
jgi:hypothetical protein